MSAPREARLFFAGLLGVLCAPAHATVQIVSLTPSVKSPQVIGTSITWIATATDTNTGPLTFQFSVGPSKRPIAMVKDFNAGTLAAGTWTSQPFVWTPTGVEGVYEIQVAIKDFTPGESATQTAKYQISPLVTGTSPVAVATANPLVALFSVPSCAAGSSMRISFQIQSKSTPATETNWLKCHPPHTMTFEIAGMYPTMTYQMFSQTDTAGKIVNGPAVSFTTRPLPAKLPIPTFTSVVPAGSQTDTTEGVILHNPFQVSGVHYPDVATDLAGNIIWYYYPRTSPHHILTRPLAGGAFLSIQDGVAWNPTGIHSQYVRQIDLAGNIVRETNTGVIQQELLALGAQNAGPCVNIPSPPPVGTACLGAFHHEAIQSLPNGGAALLADIEKIFPAGTQGDTTGLPVDIMGDIIVVLDANWQAVWYFDAFEHASGPPELDINRPAILGETCTGSAQGCPPSFLLGPGVAPKANDWLHANSLYYSPPDGDIVWSVRHQDWVVKIDYQNGSKSATGNILWRMGPDGDFTFNNVNNDPWPWFSHQHEVAMENNGAGPMTIFDNGNTRLQGLGFPGCQPSDCHSRGMSLTVDETNRQVTPVLSADLGVSSLAIGSAQLLSDGNYFFLPALVFLGLNSVVGYSLEILPAPGAITGTEVLNLQGPEEYRAWRMRSLYAPPIS